VQQSAALGGDFWSRPDMRFLCDMAIDFRFDGQDFVELSQQQIVRHYVLPSALLDLRRPPLSALHVTALCDKPKREEKLDRTWDEEKEADAEAVNDWLEQRNALIARTTLEWINFYSAVEGTMRWGANRPIDLSEK